MVAVALLNFAHHLYHWYIAIWYDFESRSNSTALLCKNDSISASLLHEKEDKNFHQFL
jgi:hypothetical protein